MRESAVVFRLARYLRHLWSREQMYGHRGPDKGTPSSSELVIGRGYLLSLPVVLTFPFSRC